MKLQDFTGKQDKIYRRMSERYKEKGIFHSPLGSQKNVLLAFRYDDQITDHVAALSERISKVIPIIQYDAGNIHTTIGSYGDLDISEDQIKHLTGIVKQGLEKPDIQFQINSQKPLIGGDSVIITGVPQNNGYINFSNDLGRNPLVCQDYKPGWGAHMTCSRFTREVSNRDEQQEVERILGEEKPLGLIEPNAIEIVSIHVPDSVGLILDTHFRIEL